MRSLLTVALGLFLSTSAFAGHREPVHTRPAEHQVRRAPPRNVVYVVERAPPAPGFVWVEGHYEGRYWVDGRWEALRPNVTISLPVLHIDLHR